MRPDTDSDYSKLYHRLLHLQLAYTWILLCTGRRSMALPTRIPALLHILHLRHVSVPARLTPSSHP